MEGQLLEETENMLSVKGNKKIVQQYIVEKAGKVVTLKDLQNISDRIKDKSVVGVNTLVDEMRKIDGKNYRDHKVTTFCIKASVSHTFVVCIKSHLSNASLMHTFVFKKNLEK